MKVLAVVVLLGVAASAVWADDDRYFLFHRPTAVQYFRPAPRPVIRPVRYVVRQFSPPVSHISPFHFFDDDHFDRKKRSAEPEPLAESPKSRQKRDSDFFDNDDFRFFPVAHHVAPIAHHVAPIAHIAPVAPRITYRPAVHYYRPNALPFYFGRGFYDD